MTAQQVFDLALQHHQAGRLAEAEPLYRAILAQQPDHVDSLLHLGIIACQMGRNDLGVELIRQAVDLRPRWPEAWYNLAKGYYHDRQFNEAISACSKAIELRSNYPEAYSNLGNALAENGQLGDAIAAYRRAIALRPDYAEAYSNLGFALTLRGQLDDAAVACRHAIALAPRFPDAHNNLAIALRQKGQLDEAIVAFRQAIALRPGFADAWCSLGAALADKPQIDEAIAAFRQTIAIKPSHAEALCNLGGVLRASGQLAESIAAYRQAISIQPQMAAFHSELLMSLHLHPDFDASAILREHRAWNSRHAGPPRRFVRQHENDGDPDRRLRIGYVSADLREHPVGRFLLPLLANHDKTRFEVFAYAHLPVPDEMTARLRSYIDGWRSTQGLSVEEVADMIRQDRIDILVDLAMHTAYNRLLVFARKPAPVQVTYLAYCSTTGLDAIDFRLSDGYMDPVDVVQRGAELIYSEETIRLKSYWCYHADDATPEVSRLPAIERGHITFGCLNNFCKISEPLVSTWISLLLSVPNARLIIHAHDGAHRQRMLDRMERSGVKPTRVEFVGFVRRREYFELYMRIDIALDTFPYGGGTTTFDALWMGVPVVSLVGKTAVGRGGLSILSHLGLPELVAYSEEEYVRIAATLAGDLPWLSHLHLTLRRRLEESPLMDAPGFARDIEAAYRRLRREL